MSLSELEVASGLVNGIESDRALPPPTPGGPRTALEASVRAALEQPPCLVSFSGGRDSSLVLAVAAHVARRQGLAEPIPVTNVFPRRAESDEREWQELVVQHLRLDEWVRLEHDENLDCIGPIAREALRRHGLLWPFNSHFHVPLLRAAKGGSLLTGVGGDEAIGEPGHARVRALLRGEGRVARRDARRLAYTLAPASLRRIVLRTRAPQVAAWLRPIAAQAVRDEVVAEAAAEPLRWSARFTWVNRLRYLRVGSTSLGALAGGEEVAIAHPLLDSGFLAALAALPRKSHFGSRAAALRVLAGDLLPPALIERRTKARFDRAFWTRHSREFAARWDGHGINHLLVDERTLRAEWSRERPDARSFLQLQAAWLASEGQSIRAARAEP